MKIGWSHSSSFQLVRAQDVVFRVWGLVLRVSSALVRPCSLFPQSGELWLYIRSEVGFGQMYAGVGGAFAQFQARVKGYVVYSKLVVYGCL